MTPWQQRCAERDARAIAGRLLRCIPSADLVRGLARYLNRRPKTPRSAIRPTHLNHG